MSNQTISQAVRGVVSDVLGVPVSSVNADSSPQTIEAWDSVQHLSLVMALEQAIGVQFEPEEIDKMRSVAAIEALVAKKKA
jgi:acyl carrier protein